MGQYTMNFSEFYVLLWRRKCQVFKGILLFKGVLFASIRSMRDHHRTSKYGLYKVQHRVGSLIYPEGTLPPPLPLLSFPLFPPTSCRTRAYTRTRVLMNVSSSSVRICHSYLDPELDPDPVSVSVSVLKVPRSRSRSRWTIRTGFLILTLFERRGLVVFFVGIGIGVGLELELEERKMGGSDGTRQDGRHGVEWSGRQA